MPTAAICTKFFASIHYVQPCLQLVAANSASRPSARKQKTSNIQKQYLYHLSLKYQNRLMPWSDQRNQKAQQGQRQTPQVCFKLEDIHSLFEYGSQYTLKTPLDVSPPGSRASPPQRAVPFLPVYRVIPLRWLYSIHTGGCGLRARRQDITPPHLYPACDSPSSRSFPSLFSNVRGLYRMSLRGGRSLTKQSPVRGLSLRCHGVASSLALLATTCRTAHTPNDNPPDAAPSPRARQSRKLHPNLFAPYPDHP